ncbi:unnamed protein product [Clonostachys byssicola]|uniref:Zn(2)-C6 fungal-type domain-containing protein n=1 Tax=Clonostachys byssicola TaxID=160290 RepID=A0A9N9U7H8_9HYPO|nr:unnamed protein product [Clonostachys byssicola]
MATRSRFGCVTCRQRKKKCDQRRPQCGQCLNRDVECGGYGRRLKWTNVVAVQGPSASEVAMLQSSPSANTNPRDHSPQSAAHASATPETEWIDGTDQPHGAHEEVSMCCDSRNSSAAMPLSDTPTTVSSVGYVVSASHVSNSASPSVDDPESQALLENSRSVNRPFLADLRDLVLKSRVLKLVCIVLQRCISEGPSISVLEHTGWVLAMFRDLISSSRHVAREELFTTGFMICILHILDVSCYGNELTQIRPNPFYHLSMRYQLETICLLDISAIVLGREYPSRGLWAKFRELQATWDNRFDGQTGACTGLPRTLLDILAKLADHQDGDILGRELESWVGPTSDDLCEHQLWESYRYAAMLEVRHRQYRRSASYRLRATDNASTEQTLFRLLSCLGAVLNDKNWEGTQKLQVQHVALYPLVYASMQVSVLKVRPAWHQHLQNMRIKVRQMANGPSRDIKMLFAILDEAWEKGVDGFDLDEAARRRGAEISII